jgi:hypothetical protein
LFDTTRAYALEKLATSGEQDSIAERHSSFLIQMPESNPVDLFDLEFTEAAIDAVQDYLGNIRAALEWSFGPNGDDPKAIRLAAAATSGYAASFGMPNMDGEGDRSDDAELRASTSDEDSGSACFVAHAHRRE